MPQPKSQQRKPSRSGARDTTPSSGDLFASVFRASPDPMSIVRIADACIIDVNDAFLRVLELEREKAIGATAITLGIWGSEAERTRFVEELRQHGVVRDLETSFVAGNGEERVGLVSSEPVVFDGAPCLLTVTHDITDRKRTERELRASEERYRALVENANDLVYTHDLQGRFTSINRAAEEVCGYSRAEAMTMGLRDIVAVEYHALVADMQQRQLAGETLPTFEIDLRPRDGRRVTVEVNTRLILADGVPVGMHGVARDVTARKRAELKASALREIARDIGGTLDLKALLDRALGRLAEVLPCDSASVFFYDEERNVFRLLSQHGLPPHLAAMAAGMDFPPGHPFSGRVLSGETLWSNDMIGEPLMTPALTQAFGVAALVVAPMRVRGRHFGSLLAANMTGERKFDAEQAELCEVFARQFGVAIEASELYRVQQEEAEVSSALALVGRELITALEAPAFLERVCEVTAKVLECDISCTLMHPADEGFALIAEFGATAPEQEAARRAAMGREDLAPLGARFVDEEIVEVAVLPAWVPAPAEPARQICMALRRGHELIGVQTATRRGQTGPFPPKLRRIARGVAQLASLALEHVRAVEELERASQVKADFVASMSHELRTPLNVIIGYHDLLMDGAFGTLTAEQTAPLQRADKSAHELLDLITATLDLSRSEARSVPLQLSEVALPELIASITQDAAHLCENAGLAVTCHSTDDVPTIVTDEVKLTMVLKNLVGNAVKFTARGSVSVHAGVSDGGVAIAVRDTGIGIAPGARGTIFEPFRQADGSIARRYGGAGLGLYLVRRLLDVLGGHITVDSQLDVGSEFTVWLPFRLSTITDAPDVVAAN